MLKLLKIEFSGIGRFTKRESISFSERSNLVQVNGRNKNTNGSSGSGKSTVFNALDYLLGINDIPATALQNRQQKDTIFVSASFDKDGQLFRIERSKKKGLSVFKVFGSTEEPVSSGNNKCSEEEIDKILGLPRDLVSKLIHKRQSKGGFFLNLKPKEVYDFLAKCLNLDQYNQKIVELKLREKASEKSLSEAMANIAAQNQVIENIQAFLSSQQKPEIDFVDNEDDLSLRLISLREGLKNKELELQAKLEEIEATRPSSDQQVVDESVLNSIYEKIERIKKERDLESSKMSEQTISLVQKKNDVVLAISKIEKEISDSIRIQTEIAVNKKELESIQGKCCPTCRQAWIGENALAMLESKQKELERKKEYLEQIEAKKPTLEKLKTAFYILEEQLNSTKQSDLYNDLNRQLDEVSQQADKECFRIGNEQKRMQSEFSKKWEEWSSNKDSIRSSLDSDISELKTKIEESSLELVQVKANKESYAKSVQKHQKDVQGILEQKDNAEKIMVFLEESVQKINKKSLEISESVRCVKGYLMNSFSDSLDFIGTKATEILNRVPSTSNCVVYFETGKETKDGILKEEVTAYINLERDTNIPISTLCGGERSAVDLAIDLAVNELIEMRSGRGFDWIALDEPFNGLDSIGKESLLNVLVEQSDKRRMFVVDHGTELKETINDVITVTRDGESSTIEE